MDMVISSVVGAVSAIIVAFIHSMNTQKRKDKTCEKIINSLNVDQGNIYIIDSDIRKNVDIENKIKHFSEGSQNKVFILIK